LLKLCESGKHAMDWKHCWKHTNSLIFYQFSNWHGWICESLLSGCSKECTFSLSKCTKWRWIIWWGRKWKVETFIFTNGKGYEFIKDPQTGSKSKEESAKEKSDCGERQRWKRWKVEKNG